MNNVVGNSLTRTNSSDPVIIRFATAGDRLAIERLAALDSAAAPAGATLIGELNHRPVVALSLRDGSAVADPFVATRELLELVRMRAGQLNSQPHPRPLQQALSRVRDRGREGRARSRAASGHERAPAAPAANA